MKEQAAASTTAFLFAGVLFMAAVGSVLFTTDDVGRKVSTSQQDTAVLSSQADGLLRVLLESPGFSSGGSDSDWISSVLVDGKKGPDRLVRLGLLKAGSPDIDFSKLENLRRAPYASSGTDGFVNYEDARVAMGLDELGLDFHIRAHPSLRSVQDLLETGVRDPNLRVTYIGDALTKNQQQIASGGSVPGVSTPTCVLGPDGKSLRISADITNTGTAATAFHAVYTVGFDDNANDKVNEEVEDTTRGPVIAASDTTPLWVDVPATDGRDCTKILTLRLGVYDPTSEQILTSYSPNYAAVSPAAASAIYRVDPDRVVHTTGQGVVVAFAGELTAKKNNAAGEMIALSVWDGATDRTADLAIPTTIEVPKSNEPWVFQEFPANNLGAGTYEMRLARTNGQIVTDQLIIVPSAPGPYVPSGGTPASGYAFTDGAKIEIEFLDSLVDRFCPYDWDSQSSTPVVTEPWGDRCNAAVAPPYPAHSSEKQDLGQFGDIFPDDKQLLGNHLPGRLQNPDKSPRMDIVNTLVVGSNVDHNTMTSEAVKGSIEKWVLGGGMLIVFGSEKQTVQWLQSIFKASIDSSNGGVSTPDQNHPMLHVADELVWDAYDTQGRAWDLKTNGNHNKNITRVVEDDAGNSILAISDPGAYGDGTIIVTSWLPYDLFNTGAASADCSVNIQGCALMNNLLMQGYRDLFLDYGPEIPPDVLSVPAKRVAQVWHPELERHIALDVELFVFPRQ